MSSLATDATARAFRAGARRNIHLVLDGRGLWDGTQRFDDLAAWAAWTTRATSEQPLPADASLQLHVSGELLLECPCPQGLDFAHDGDRIDWARRLLQRYHGGAAPGSWVLAAWGGRQTGVTAWLPAGSTASVAADWRAAARAASLRLRSVRPLWATACAHALSARPDLRRAAQANVLFVEGESVSVLTLRRGKLQQVVRRRLAAPTMAALRQFVSDQGLSSAAPVLALGAGLQSDAIDPAASASTAALLQTVDDLKAPLPWRPPLGKNFASRALPGPDFLHPFRQPGLFAWLALVVAGVIVLLAAFQAWSLHQAVQQARAAAAASAAAATRPALAHPQSAMLAYPWRETLLAVETAAGTGLRWNSLDADHRARLQLQGLAADDASVRELAARLRAAVPGREVSIARSEAAADGQRFELQVRAPATAGPR